LTSIYMVMPVGRLKLRHALIGGITAALLWELTRHILVWYFATLSQVNVVYGSLTTAIAVVLSLEFAATLLLLGAQVIAEYERMERAAVLQQRVHRHHEESRQGADEDEQEVDRRHPAHRDQRQHDHPHRDADGQHVHRLLERHEAPGGDGAERDAERRHPLQHGALVE